MTLITLAMSIVIGYNQANADYFTVKYNTDGGKQWVASYNSPPGYETDIATSLAVDDSGSEIKIVSSFS